MNVPFLLPGMKKGRIVTGTRGVQLIKKMIA
jgi:hypothetical protein